MNLLFWYRSLMRSVSAALVKLIVTATSGLVSFTTNVIRPVKVICEFSPVQEGTGDPSPDNVRPISGWTQADISHALNIIDSDSEKWVQGGRDGLKGILNPNVLNRITQAFAFRTPVNGNTQYTFFCADDFQFIPYFYNGGTYQERLSDSWNDSGTSFNTPLGTNYIAFMLRKKDNSNITPDVVESAKLNMPGTPEIISIVFTDPTTGDPLTVYGGTLTLNEDGSADLVVTHYSNIIPPRLQGLEERTDYIGSYRNLTGLGFPAIYSGDYFICDKAEKRTTQVQPTDGRAVWLYGNTYVRVWVRKDLLSTLDTDGVNEWVANNPLRLCYRRATPITYHFDNIGQLQSFLGTNNIWHNMNGSITAEYYKKQ